MLNQTEKEGFRRLLGKLNVSELVSLADTVTKRQISVSGKTEAMTAILTYTDSAVELMRRRKMKRDILFQYLVEVGVVTSVSADKKDLMQKILKHWGTPVVDFSDMDVDMSEENLTSPTHHTSTATNTAMTIGGQQSPVGVQTDTQFPQDVGAVSNVGNHTPQTVDTQNHFSQQHVIASRIPSQTVGDVNSASKTDSTMHALGEQFAKWYYEILNSFNPTTPDSPKDFGPQHFWDDAKLKVNAVTPSPAEEEYLGPQMVAERLISFTKDEQLLFNPNIGSEGVFVKSSPHGLVMVMVCGTIHRGNDCLGVFQQVFGIIRDPRFNDNWKIKVTYLDVKSSQVTAMPKLEGNIDSFISSLVPV